MPSLTPRKRHDAQRRAHRNRRTLQLPGDPAVPRSTRRSPDSTFRFPNSDVETPTSKLRLQTSDFELQPSCFLLRISTPAHSSTTLATQVKSDAAPNFA